MARLSSSGHCREGRWLDFFRLDQMLDAHRILHAIERRALFFSDQADDAINAMIRITRGGAGDPDKLPEVKCVLHQRLRHPSDATCMGERQGTPHNHPESHADWIKDDGCGETMTIAHSVAGFAPDPTYFRRT